MLYGERWEDMRDESHHVYEGALHVPHRGTLTYFSVSRMCC